MILLKEVEEYFVKCFPEVELKDLLRENSINSLVFSYFMGMDPSECKRMEVETEFGPDEIREYEEVEDIIIRLKKKYS